MSREMAVVLLGVWVIVLPHLGVPHTWAVIITTATGLAIIVAGLYARAKLLTGAARRSTHHPFVENAGGTDGIHEHSTESN
jgi:hypothetical protein